MSVFSVRPVQRSGSVLVGALLVAGALVPAGRVAAAAAVPPGTLFSFQVTTPSFTNRYLRHAGGLARTDVISAGSSELDRQDATFWARPGLADPSCVSFQSFNYPDRYLRHANYRLRTDVPDGSALFNADATFCPQAGQAGDGVSFESWNYRGLFIRHIDAEVYIARNGGPNPWDNPGSYQADVTWKRADPWWRPAGARPITPYSRTAVVQLPPAAGQAVGAVEYAYTDNIGRLRYAHQDPDRVDVTQWTALSGDEGFTGTPALSRLADGRLQVAGYHLSGSIWADGKATVDGPGWNPWSALGGPMAAPPVAGQLTEGGTSYPVLFAVDADGQLLAYQQDGPFPYWRPLGGGDLSGALTVTRASDGVRIVALDRGGAARTAVYRVGGALSAWTDLGGSGLTGTPATVVYPGFRTRVVARAADGTVVTNTQSADGSWTRDWQPVGSFTALGSPAAVLDPVTSRTSVVARGADKQINVVTETAQGSGQWGAWSRILDGSGQPLSDTAETDPTVAPVTNSNGQTWYIVFRNRNDATRVYERQAVAAVAGLRLVPADRTAAPSFAARSLPTP